MSLPEQGRIPRLMIGGPGHGKAIVVLYGRSHVLHGPDNRRYEYREETWVHPGTGREFKVWVHGKFSGDVGVLLRSCGLL